MTQSYFHFTLGPVQGFVAQARRTRDFWAGSFLLSWLSAVAMRAVIQQQGEIIFPKADQNYLNWLEGKDKDKDTSPQQGCVPNRFKGGLARVPADFQPQQVVDSIQQAWMALGECVWHNDLAACSEQTRAIWQRQVQHFWEISWALSADVNESNLLDRRKNWRSYLPPEETGVKCMMMDGWQELSGIASPNSKDLARFWRALRQNGQRGMGSDLREHEYLCAIALIKRRFARYFHELTVPMPGGWRLSGWSVNPAVPSVAYMAAAPWLAKVLDQAPESALRDFHDAAKQLTASYGEYATDLQCINNILDKYPERKLLWYTKNLDGNVFFEAALDNENIYANQTLAQQTKKKLNALRRSLPETIESVSPFYAVLMMDGDSLGSHMSDVNKQQHISDGLNQFTQGVPEIVEENSGFLVYAGGDDVLALLPLEFALKCAQALRSHYLTCFAAWPDINTTLSGAIEYAHIRMPLGKVLSDAHQLLDDIAKEHTGRDAIAVRVWKPGGQHLQWAMPWEKALNKDGEVIMQTLADDFAKDQQKTPFSNSFFFHVEERFALVNRGDVQPFSNDELVDLIAADYLSSGVHRVAQEQSKITLEQARQRLQDLLSQCFLIKRHVDESKVIYNRSARLDTDALQLVRFLAQKGVDHG
ncbi:type III-B CRISPR-associated protein Cas10/Cmr2 [Methylotuvimicrobium sp. KM2]|uniref:type III-B CRISPR-associated protein Cas10/Cmr2 n=1 Tax=Methylotuvimicrobium sp. KM2 TaxID=3133976 RepID=UPI0031017AD1